LLRRVAVQRRKSVITDERAVETKTTLAIPWSGPGLLRLSKALGRSPESWLALQDQYDLWVARQTVDLGAVEPIRLDAT
jgi:plasmid maintenance system antidote protein VapI